MAEAHLIRGTGRIMVWEELMKTIRTPLVLVAACMLLPDAIRSFAVAEEQAKPAVSAPETALVKPGAVDEAKLIGRIKELTRRDRTNYPPEAERAIRLLEQQDTLELIENLLKRFPGTSFREDAVIIKLGIYAEFSRIKVEYLEQLLAMTQEIAAGKPSKILAAENDFYAIQAFVYAARNEGMPVERLRLGTAERYRAFLDGYPESPRRPIIYASLVRVLVQQGRHADAQELLEQFRSAFPQHSALRRAEGEVARMEAIGQPYDFAFLTAPGGKSITEVLSGKVVVLHFWASWSARSTELVTELRSLQDLYGSGKLAVVGVNLDTDQRTRDAALEQLGVPWSQFSDLKGFKSDVVISSGVVSLPTTLIVDPDGILQALSDGRDLREVLRKLIASEDSD